MRPSRKTVRLLAALALALVAGLLDLAPWESGSRAPAGDTASVVRAIQQRLSDQHVEADARVTKILPDDTYAPRHQRILVDIGGHSVLIAHNIDLAPRVPVRRGDHIRVRGEFEWNDKGGVIHWTHRAARGRRAGGWIEYRGERFQ